MHQGPRPNYSCTRSGKGDDAQHIDDLDNTKKIHEEDKARDTPNSPMDEDIDDTDTFFDMEIWENLTKI